MKPNKTKDENTNTDNTGIMKERSFASCLSASFNLYCSNFATIFKHTWLPSLVLALTMSAGTLLPAAPLSVTVTAALGVCVVAAMTIIGAWFDASYMSLFNGMTRRQTTKRALCVRVLDIGCGLVSGLLILGVMLVIFAIALSIKTLKTRIAFIAVAEIPATVVTLIIIIVVCIPLVYSFMSYLADPTTTPRQIFTSRYRRGWHNWGYLFAVTALTALVMAVVVFVLSAPSLVLSAALGANHTGMLLGDPDGIPSNFLLLYYVSNAIVLFVFNYTMIWTFLTVFHAYGSIECKTESKKKELAHADNI